MPEANSDIENRAAAALITLIADANRQIRTLGFALRDVVGVESTTWSHSISFYASNVGAHVDFDLSAELSNGDALAWGLCLYYQDGTWWVEASINVYRNVRHSTEDTLLTFPTTQAGNLSACRQAVEVALSYIEASLPAAEAVTNSETDTLLERARAAALFFDANRIPYVKVA